ncbi:MAG: hypothetical protein IT366_02085 [Candidatus Hydrogenedentes bacterium]|nr:hypothetical protein [Candidatus Hydrogenedentota bacterium]
MSKQAQILAAVIAIASLAGCSNQSDSMEKTTAPVLVPAESTPADSDLAEKAAPAAHEEHHHAAPHNGTLIMLGDHAGHLEFVLDNSTGTLTLYALDGEAEQPVRLNSLGLAIQLTVPGKDPVSLELKPVENVLTGETGTSTSQYAAQNDTLKGVTEFSAIIPELAFRGMELENLTINFPAGNE